MSEKKLIHQPGKMLFVASFMVVTALVLFNTVLGLVLLRESQNDPRLAQVIIRAVDALNRPLVIEPLSGKAYIPSAKLVLPPNSELSEVVYAHNRGGDGFKEEVTLASASDIHQASAPVLGGQNLEATFAAIPKLQACAHSVYVKFGAENLGNNLTPAGMKILNNKTEVHFYTDRSCPNPELLEYAKQINSY